MDLDFQGLEHGELVLYLRVFMRFGYVKVLVSFDVPATLAKLKIGLQFKEALKRSHLLFERLCVQNPSPLPVVPRLNQFPSMINAPRDHCNYRS